MRRVGLTGGIGAGKSTVLHMLAACGAGVIDADAISRSVTAPGGAAIPAIAQRFGAGFIAEDGSLDRLRMRQEVYADPQSRQALEQIIHPLVRLESARQVAAAEAAGIACLVFDIPLLVESKRWREQLDRVVVVDCSEATQLARVVARSGLSESQVEAIIAAQASRGQRLEAADDVICNEGLTLEQLAFEARELARGFGL